MICAVHLRTQEVQQNQYLTLSQCTSLNCNAQLRDNRIDIFFPGVYEIQWSIVAKLKNSGKIKVQAYNQEKPIMGSYVAERAAANQIHTLTTAPMLITAQKPEDMPSFSLKNIGDTIIISDVVLYVDKKY